MRLAEGAGRPLRQGVPGFCCWRESQLQLLLIEAWWLRAVAVYRFSSWKEGCVTFRMWIGKRKMVFGVGATPG